MSTIIELADAFAEYRDHSEYVQARAILVAAVQELERDAARMRDDLLPLQIFMDSVFGEFPEHGDVDGFTLQDIAESCGLLVPEKRSEACGENCTCVTYVDSAGFTKDWTCYRVQGVMRRARIAAARAALKETP